MKRRISNIFVSLSVSALLLTVFAVGSFADLQPSREYNVSDVQLVTSSNNWLYEITYFNRTFGNHSFGDMFHNNGVYKYDCAQYQNGTLTVPYPPYTPVYVDYRYLSDKLPSENNGFEMNDFLYFHVNDINKIILEGYFYIDFEVVSFKGASFTTFQLYYTENGENKNVSIPYTSPQVHKKSTLFLPNLSQAQAYNVETEVARYVIDGTGLVPAGATLKRVEFTVGIPRIPITPEIANSTPENRRHVNYIAYVTPVYVTMNDTDLSMILYETSLANDKLTMLQSTNQEIYNAIQRNTRYERMVDNFLNTMGRVDMSTGGDIAPDVDSATLFFSMIYNIEPIPSMLALSVTFLFIGAFVRRA